VAGLVEIAKFLQEYGWLGVALLIMVLWLGDFLHSDREFKREVGRGDRLESQRDAAIKLSQELLDAFEKGARRR
jgi:hypothetical protein